MSCYARALFDFSSAQSGEIPLTTGDVVEVIRKVDDNWLCGRLYDQVGNFPASFVQQLEIPPVMTGEKVFAAIKQFSAEMQGDLAFQKGDIVIGTQPVDDNWWKGKKGWETGIFPITHVVELNVITAPIVPSHEGPQVIPSSAPQVVPSSGTVIAKACASMDLTAQLDDELGFCKGDVIDIIEILDADFAFGMCNGKCGQFPLTFVEVFEGNVEPISEKSEKRKSKFRWWEEEGSSESSNHTPLPLPQTDPPIVHNSIGSNQTQNGYYETDNSSHVKHNTQPYSTNSHSVPEQSQQVSILRQNSALNNPGTVQTHRRQGSYTSENTRSCDYDAGITPYGKTLFPFVAENSNELTFFDNEIVTLIRHVDDQWLEGEIDGKTGIFPSSYVEIIVDCPWADEITPNSVLSATVSDRSQKNDIGEIYDDEIFGLVMFDFKPESAMDLDMQEGDTVTLLRKLDDNWFEARHDDGRVGLCPVSYIQVLGAVPTTPATPSTPQRDSVPLPVGPCMNSESTESKDSSCVEMPPSVQSDEGFTTEKIEKPEAVSKSNIGRPKPSLKPKPQLKPKPKVSRTSSSPLPKEEKVPTPLTQEVQKTVSVNETRASPVTVSNAPPRPPVIPMRSIDKENEKGLKAVPAVQRPPSPKFVNRSLSTDTASEVNQHKEHPRSNEESLSPKVLMHGSGTVQFSRSNSDEPRCDMKPETLEFGESTFFSPDGITKERQQHAPPSRPAPPNDARIKRPPPPRPEGPRPAPAPSKTPLLPGPNRKSDLGPKPVPQRPAPPRPSHMPARPAVRPRKGGDLMDFSPEKPTSEFYIYHGQDEDHAEVVADLENRLAEIDKDIKKYKHSCEELDQMMGVVDEAEKAEIQETKQVYIDNIKGLEHDHQQLLENLYKLQPERAHAQAEAKLREEELKHRLAEEKKRKQEKRAKVIAEILSTEQDYLQSLNLAVETFLNNENEKCAAVDLEMLFCNIDEVLELSQKLLSSLEGCVSGREFGDQVVGTSFIALKEDMIKVYAPYCRNHDDVTALLEKYEENPEIQGYLNRMLELLRQQVAVFDLGSILIKPVQRVLKYPLLLNELIKATENDHPDKEPLLEAINAMTEVATAINEYKRRKDLVRRYKQDTDNKLADKIARLSMHSTKKKFIRVTRRMVGVTMIDEDFVREERKFNNLDKTVRTFVKDVTLYLEQLQETVGLSETVAHDIADFYGERSSDDEVEKFCRVHTQLSTSLFTKFRGNVENQVVVPLNRLLLMFQGPMKVIKKRHDKLLDYDNAQSRVKNLSKESDLYKGAQAELQMAKNNYAALNAQLLDELPQLFALAVDVVRHCVARLVHAQRTFHGHALEEMYQLLGLQMVLESDKGNIIEHFNIAHTTVVDRLSDLSFIPRTFNPAKEDKKPTNKSKRTSMHESRPSLEGEPSSQSDSQRMYLRQLYAADRLFQVVSDFAGGGMMDLALTAGTMVGVIKEGDPMGNKDRWYVDNGESKGFIPKKFLTMVTPEKVVPTPAPRIPTPSDVSASPPSTIAATGNSTGTPGNLMDLSSPEEKPPAKATPIPPDLDFSLPSDTQGASSGSTWYQPGLVDEEEEDKILEEMMSEDLDEPDITLPPYSPPEHPAGPPQENMCYRAVYSFTARSPIEVTLQEGQLITVVQKNDLDGNSEWWLVDADGRQGYAPANYLYAVE